MSANTNRMSLLKQNYLAKLGMFEWLRSVDHKRIGIMFLVSGLFTFLIGGVFALLLRTELFAPGRTIMDAHMYNVVFTLHGTIMIFLFVVPGIISSFGNIFMPIMIGAPRCGLSQTQPDELSALAARFGYHCAEYV